jgi:hypothetical protein
MEERFMEITEPKLVKRWNSVMEDIGCEHITINTRLSELESNKAYYQIEDGISIGWMISEAEYWLSCYYESGNVRCDDRFYDEDCYKTWVSETGKLKRLIARLEKMYDEICEFIVIW